MDASHVGQSCRSTLFRLGCGQIRLIKPSFRDPSLKQTEEIKDKDGERQTDTGWGLCEGHSKAIDH